MSSNYLTWYLSFDCDRIIIEIQKYNLEHILFTRENKSTISEDLNFNSNGIITTSYPDATLSSLSGNKEKVIFNKQAEKLKSRKMKNSGSDVRNWRKSLLTVLTENYFFFVARQRRQSCNRIRNSNDSIAVEI